MHRIVPVAVTLLFGAATLAAQQKIKVSTASVPVYVTVFDSTKHLVPDLVQEDFEVLDNSKPQTISVFENKPTPITDFVHVGDSVSVKYADGKASSIRVTSAKPAAAPKKK